MLTWTKNLSLLLGSAALAGSAMAAEVMTTTKAPFQVLFPNSYSSLEFSHHAKSQPNKPADATRVDAVYTLGSTFFNDRLDLSFSAGVKKYANSSQIYQKSVDNEIWLTAYKNRIFEIKPYLLNTFAYVDHEGQDHSPAGQFGVMLPLSHTQSTVTGAVTFGAYYDGSARFNNRYRVTVTENGQPITSVDGQDDDTFALTRNDKGEFEVEPRALALRQDAALLLGYAPNKIAGLSFEWKSRYRVDYTPIMEYDRVNHEVYASEGNLLNQQYRSSGYASHRFRAKYDISKVFYLQNDFNFKHERAENNKVDYVNVLALGAKLF